MVPFLYHKIMFIIQYNYYSESKKALQEMIILTCYFEKNYFMLGHGMWNAICRGMLYASWSTNHV